MVRPFLLDLVVWPWRAVTPRHFSASFEAACPDKRLIHVVLVSWLPHSSATRWKRKKDHHGSRLKTSDHACCRTVLNVSSRPTVLERSIVPMAQRRSLRVRPLRRVRGSCTARRPASALHRLAAHVMWHNAAVEKPAGEGRSPGIAEQSVSTIRTRSVLW